MQCKKCSINIPGEFEYVITQNVCPKCGSKLMPPKAMAIFLDLKKRLQEVEFVMDKSMVCERIAMFMISNYEVIPLNGKLLDEVQTSSQLDKIESIKKTLKELDAETELSEDEIREQEAMRAEEIAAAREMGLDIELEPDEEFVSGNLDSNKIERLRKLATSGLSKGVVRRVTE